MIHELVVTNSANESLPLNLMMPETSGFIIRRIDGLGPAKTNINMREKSGTSGSTFNSARTTNRNIVLTLEFMESPTIEASRLRSYRYFPNEEEISLDFKTDAGTFHIVGLVESNEPDIFSEKETTVISILCPDPFFVKEGELIKGEIARIDGLFMFPFTNEGNANTIVFGEKVFETTNFSIPFNGTVGVAPILTLKAEGGPVVNPRIIFYSEKKTGVLESLSFVFTDSLPQLEDGDYLRIVCERQNKSITRYIKSNDTFVNYLGALAPDSGWPILHQGNNIFSYEADSGLGFIRFSYEYPLKYIGI